MASSTTPGRLKVLLINPPVGPRTIGLRNIARIEPLGLELVGAGISKDHDVRLVDMEVRAADLDDMLREFSPDVAGVTCEIVHVDTAIEALQRVRAAAPDCLRVIGGHHPTVWPQDFDRDGVDIVVLGEGVETFAEICAARAAGADSYDDIPGLMLRDETGLRPTAVPPLPKTLDHQPPPDRSLTARYRDQYFYLFEDSVAAIRTSAGCSFPCIFCSCRVYSQKMFIPRSPELVFEDICATSEDFIMFCDDHSFHDPERMRILGEMLEKAGVRKRYFAYARSDSIVENREVFALWARIGLTLVMTGLEAVDEAALKRTGKKTDIANNEEAMRILQDLGVHLSAGFLVDHDFEKADFKRINTYIGSHPAILLAEFTPLTPFPGTPLYRQTRKKMLTDDRQVYDLQHFLMPTKLPPQQLYRHMIRSYLRVGWRVVKALELWRPSVLFSKRGRRVLIGFLRNFAAFQKAHLNVPPAPQSQPQSDAATGHG